MTSKKKFYIAFLMCAAIYFAALLIFAPEFLEWPRDLKTKLQRYQKGTGDFLVEEIKKEIFTPSPLRHESLELIGAQLTRDGIIKATNKWRQENGLEPLAQNTKLNTSAQYKAGDIITRQYFEHISPTGEGVSDLAGKVDYKYISIGENLALGNFKSDEDLVEAWMNSPGHRANILNSKYEEIGIGIIRGEFEGNTIWVAVQHFAMPFASCPSPDPGLTTQIETLQAQVDELNLKISQLSEIIKNTKPRDREEYNKLISEYNILATEYNYLLDKLKLLINRYNSEVAIFNNCINSVAN